MAQAKQQMRVKGEPSAVRHPGHGGYVVPDPRDTYAPDDPIVKAYPWMFEPADTRSEPEPPPESVPIERATQAPGERRQTRRTR